MADQQIELAAVKQFNLNIEKDQKYKIHHTTTIQGLSYHKIINNKGIGCYIPAQILKPKYNYLAKAKFSVLAANQGQLSFQKDDILEILDQQGGFEKNSVRAVCRRTKEKGLVIGIESFTDLVEEDFESCNDENSSSDFASISLDHNYQKINDDPDLKYYNPNLESNKALALLQNQPIGSFLIRKCSKGESFRAISVVISTDQDLETNHRVRNYLLRLEYDENGRVTWVDPAEERHNSLSLCVEFYSKNCIYKSRNKPFSNCGEDEVKLVDGVDCFVGI